MAKNKEDRYASAAEMMMALEERVALLDTRPTVTLTTAAPLPGSPKWWWVAAAAMLLAGAFAIYEWWPAKGHVPDPQAYELYLRGRRDIQEYTEHGFKQSVVDFKNAIQRDPEFAAAYAGLADAYSYQAAFELEPAKDVMPLAESNAARAIEKDPLTAEAYTALGIVALGYYWDLPLAEQRFQRALGINPKDAFTQHWLGHYYEQVGKWPEAVKQMQLAHEMDKLSPMYQEDLAWDLFVTRRNEDAVAQLRETVGLAPEDPYAHALLALALEATGKSAESLEQAQAAWKLPGNLLVAGTLSGIFSRLHRPDMAQDLLKQLEAAEKAGKYVTPLQFAMVHFALGDKMKGMARMTEAVKERCINTSMNSSDPVFDIVREDAEFAALMNEMHVPRANWHDLPRYSK